uniref:Mediator of RNA polymerase II transcription subunit 6 n=1 Tax=Romanomermis culicivorax TaxID=13658 RepID=A0A915HL17_ROMCU
MSGPHQSPWSRPGQPPGFYPMIEDAALLSNPLHISWQDTHFPTSYATNILEYFSNPYNPFYEQTCINENLKMQGHSIEEAVKHTGVEYTVIKADEPLFVIRKQKRHNPNQVTPLADYYIIGGMAYQAPDLCSVVNSRLLSSVHATKAAFKEASSYMRYHPSKGYWWNFNDGKDTAKTEDQKEASNVRATVFQRTRVDTLLADLASKFPPPKMEESQTESSIVQTATTTINQSSVSTSSSQQQLTSSSKTSQFAHPKVEGSSVSAEKSEPPPKKPKTEASQ